MSRGRSGLRRATRAVLAASVAGLPRRHAVWGRAMLAEIDAIADPEEQLAWTTGALMAVVRSRLRTRSVGLWLAGVLAASGVLAFVDRSPSDDAGQFAMATLLLAAAGLGFALPAARVVTGLALGSALSVAHLGYLLVGADSTHPSAVPADALGLFVLIVPAMIAALVGGALRRGLGPGGN
jgi:hypothetical protein